MEIPPVQTTFTPNDFLRHFNVCLRTTSCLKSSVTFLEELVPFCFEPGADTRAFLKVQNDLIVYSFVSKNSTRSIYADEWESHDYTYTVVCEYVENAFGWFVGTSLPYAYNKASLITIKPEQLESKEHYLPPAV
jgi:hypothetical protein